MNYVHWRCKVCIHLATCEWPNEIVSRDGYRDPLSVHFPCTFVINPTEIIEAGLPTNPNGLVAPVNSPHVTMLKKIPEGLDPEQLERVKQDQHHVLMIALVKARTKPAHFDYAVADWQFALAYFDYRCAICGRQYDKIAKGMSIDHWLGWREYPHVGTVPQNIVPLCHGCNAGKGNRTGEYLLTKRYGDEVATMLLKRIETFLSLTRQAPIREEK